MKIYLVRHGECDSNKLGIYNYKNEDLNENGISSAYELSKKIKDIDYDVVITSSMLRAKHTASIINILNKEIICDDRLVERSSGILEGKPLDTCDRLKYWNYYSESLYHDEESIQDLVSRVSEFLEELKTKDYKSVLIVAHSGVSKAFYVYFNGMPDDGNLLDKGLKNLEIKEYYLENIE